MKGNTDKEMKWEILHSEYLIQRPWLTARRDHIRMPYGVENDEYYVLEYPDWINVIAITPNGEFVMEKQSVPESAKKEKRLLKRPSVS